MAGNLSGIRSGIAAYFKQSYNLDMGTRTIGKRACFCTSFSRWPYAKVAIFGETRKRKRWLDNRNMVNEIKNNAIGKNNS